MSGIGPISTSGLIAAQIDLAVVATDIANSTDDGSSAPPGPSSPSAVSSSTPSPRLLTGSQPGTAAGQVFQALSATNTETAGGGVTANISTGSGLLSPGTIQDLTALNAAATAYQTNLATLEAGRKLTEQALGLIA